MLPLLLMLMFDHLHSGVSAQRSDAGGGRVRGTAGVETAIIIGLSKVEEGNKRLQAGCVRENLVEAYVSRLLYRQGKLREHVCSLLR